MASPRVIVLRTAGTNCDEETAHAWSLAGATPSRVHVRELMERPALLKEFGILTIPGGFSYGDDISAGKILAMQIIHHLSDALREFVSAGKLVLGICNGFQVLVKAGLLPGGLDDLARQSVTLTNNDSARFEARWVQLRTSSRPNAFLPPDRILALPIAHGEGKLVAGPLWHRPPAGEDTGETPVPHELVRGGHVALTYCDHGGHPGPYPINPNGSELDIAGLVDATGRILGLMPHPERHVEPYQHPEWTQRRTEMADGRIIFESAVRAAS